MKAAYFDCASGISGDMTLGALVDAGADLPAIQQAVDSLGLPHCRLATAEVKKKAFRALQLTVEHSPEHAHRHLHHIVEMIERSRLSDRARATAVRIFERLAEAEARVHGTTVEKVHFHEVGAVDSIADIVGTAAALDLLGVERIVCSPVPVGGGFVEIAHGRCRVPAPATAELLRGVPLAASSVEFELTTPTGAAIVSALAEQFGPVPEMTIEAIGYGAGQRDLDAQANLLRVIVGTAAADGSGERCWMLQTNIDDATGELLGYCSERLHAAGALDVTMTPVHMKKGRPGITLGVLCREAEVTALEALLLAETTTLGVRRWPVTRNVLHRRRFRVETPLGSVAGKLAWSKDVPPRFSPEYESCRAIAEKRRVPLAEVFAAAHRAFNPGDLPADVAAECAADIERSAENE